MSLVNDALRRAKDAQQNVPPPPESRMQFRPADPARHARQNLGLMVPVLLALLALLALFSLWQWAQGRSAAQVQQARALTPTSAPAVAAHQPVLSVAPTATVATPAAAISPAPKPGRPTALSAAAPAAVATALPPAAAAASIAVNLTNEVTNVVAITPVVVSKPPLRLQAIVYDPKRPSALISGKSVFIGEKVGDSRVVAIDQESATLVSGGKTNVLSLLE